MMLAVNSRTLAWFFLLAISGVCVSAQQQQRIPAASPSWEATQKYEGRRIQSIQWEPASQPLTETQLKGKLGFGPGALFSATALRKGIQNLFATGRYADLAVDAAESGDGIALRFLTQRAYFVGRILLSDVKQPPNRGELASATKLRLGEPYNQRAGNAAVASMLDSLHRNGLLHATVSPSAVFHPDTESVDLSFGISPGERAHFRAPLISGHPGRNEAAIIRATRWKRLYGLLGWQPVTEARLRQGLDHLRRDYEKQDRLQSSVTLTKLDYDDETNTVQPSLTLEQGPRISILVKGASVSRTELRQIVPVFQERAVDSELLVEGQRNLAQYLQAKGYFEAAVTYQVSRTSKGDQTITYDVETGRRHKLVHLAISGNHYFSSDTIRERLYIQTAAFPRFPYGRFSAGFLKQDLGVLESLYAANGFRDVRILPKVVDNYRGVKGHLAVSLEIQEGVQWHVGSLRIEGANARDLVVLQPLLASTTGQPFSSSSISQDRDAILRYFYGRGFIHATFAFFEELTEAKHSAGIRYVIDPGIRQFVRDVLVSGLETTRPRVVYSRITMQRGEPLSLGEETDSQRRLYDLGIFARVNTAIQNPDGDEIDKYVLYDIDEARHYSLNVGVGAQIARIGGGATSLDNPAGTTGFAPRLALGLSRINFLGLGQTIGIQTAVSTIEQRAAGTYFIPQFGPTSNLNLVTTALIENSNDIRTYTAHRRELSLQLGQRVSRAYTFQYRLVFRDVTLSNLKINREIVPLLSQPERLGLAEFSVIQDKRDDPADAHQGVYSTINLSYAPGFLGSQTSFARGLFRNSSYYTIHRDFVFARSTQFGVITRLGGGHTIPLAERLYSGGSTSLRSFPDFQAGPRDLQTGFVLGGNALFVNNLELRFPLFGDNIRGVLFEDAGNVYRSLGAVSFRYRQQNLQDFDYMVQSAGIGIRYQTPIGPLRLDFSFSPNAPRFFGLKGTLEDLVNNTAVATVQKINAFQFHISLGQAF